MLELFFWLVFGLVSGWAVALVAEPQAASKRVGRSGLFGMLGALVGGGLARYFIDSRLIGGFNAMSLLIAVVAAILFASIFNLVTTRWYM